MSGGHNKSSSKQQQTSQTAVWDQMSPFLTDMYRQGQGLQGEQMGQAQGLGAQAIQAALGGIAGGGIGALGNLASGGISESLATRASGQQNPFLQGNINALGENINLQLGEQMQGIGTQAGLAGGVGGGRQGVAEGLAIQGAQRQFAQGANQMLSQDYINQGRYAQEALGFSQGALGGYLGGQQQAMNLGLGGLGAQWQPLMMQAGLLGPAVLESYGQGTGKSSSFGMHGGMGG